MDPIFSLLSKVSVELIPNSSTQHSTILGLNPLRQQRRKMLFNPITLLIDPMQLTDIFIVFHNIPALV